ncbi:MAG: hypothetical protein JO040_01580 [Gemmatimonadetes bacterium]|nr:hypothetical protein [Gemmatimonadota bacterium]
MLRNTALTALLLTSFALPARADVGVTLRGSHESMVRQNEIAKENAYSFLRTPEQVKEYVAKGFLVPVAGNADYTLAKGVSFAYTRPEVHAFIEYLGREYRQGCGEQLVVTSLTRPEARQPSNASNLSVHPAGMAMDVRAKQTPKCKVWLESTLLGLEKQGVLDVTREVHPPHYHVAVFPGPMRAYLAKVGAPEPPAPSEAHPVVPAQGSPMQTLSRKADQPGALVPAMERRHETSGTTRMWLILLAISPLGMALGLRGRGQRHPTELD